ncbi:MAG TPA: acetoacetate--CoA ligase, partial [Dongiaceae bacterium]|nr:acetoacetate--CoA ligase [Dongiaceae bacterium]
MTRASDQPLWRPSPAAIAASNMSRFRARVARDWSVELADTDALWRWSVGDIERFWLTLWRFCEVTGEPGKVILKDRDRMPGAQFFPEARLNYAENMLRFSRPDFSRPGGEGDAIVFWGEDKVKRRLSHAELHDRVSRLAQHLRGLGLKPGDRVAGFVPNAPEAVIGAFAAAAIGCIWSSCSPDFGVQGVLDRFGQIEPKVLLTADGYWYGGKQFDSLARVAEFSAKLPSLQQILVFPYLSDKPDLSKLPKAKLLPEALAAYPGGALQYERVKFNHPLFIMYSSGTTGVPKCIVHGHGGTLLQHLKEHRLHGDVKPRDRVFYFTTCGWMMWNWLISGLGSEATLLLYDGSPFTPTPNALWDYAQDERINVFGTSAKYIDACAKAGIEPKKTHDLSTVRMITSTGSPLAPESFDYIYEKVKSDVKPGDRVFYFTTCGWMMWNWLVSGLASGATLLLYDGSPFHPSGNILFDFADAEGMTLFGTSAKWIDACAKAGLEPMRTHSLASVRTMTSTGSPLSPESFEYVYAKVKRDLCLSSISGGTDIVSCFVLGNPIGPVWKGEIQAPGLGMAVEVWDDEGRKAPVGEK